MAYLRRFKDSRYWFACFKGVNGKRLQRSTKETDRRLAQKIADRYEGTAAQASLGFLVERQARKVIGEIYEISTREKLRSDSVRDFFTRWLERVNVELNHKTFKRYEGVTAEFLNWLGPRASLSIAHLSSALILSDIATTSPASIRLRVSTFPWRRFSLHLEERLTIGSSMSMKRPVSPG